MLADPALGGGIRPVVDVLRSYLASEHRSLKRVLDYGQRLGNAGWLLAGISQHAELGRQWAFKGGTCLKKCYFETYRFSKDLDFTLRDPGQLDEGLMTSALREVADWVYEEAGMELPERRSASRSMTIPGEESRRQEGSDAAPWPFLG